MPVSVDMTDPNLLILCNRTFIFFLFLESVISQLLMPKENGKDLFLWPEILWPG